MLQIMIEILVFRPALAKAHKLNVAYELFYLIVSLFGNACKNLERLGVFHTGYLYKRQIVHRLCTSVAIIMRVFECAFGVHLCRVKISVVIAVRNIVQPVYLSTIACVVASHSQQDNYCKWQYHQKIMNMFVGYYLHLC